MVYYSDTQLAKRYETHRTTIWRWVKTSGFPKPIKLSKGCSRWDIEEVEAWERRKKA
ncbi:MAG TPA: AlpA family transcriptional regulator [Desulfobacter sp.]|uniref:helix-turn-helix transcriptional regulator n=1 Tax=Desulfobacter sp. UBA2225 TaxID=1961413 RepID=UPI000E858BE2|nr:AlpA family phage regulatory protein [Desulfobacter sp. UBA2225]HAR34795.1 AlpA family transcriptional regulator [Desulfobacter sp.]